ncbi:MAG: cbb3-type cytochrome c oxidase subunit II [Verrucomicrobiota bacterium]|nr:cbb3-type cytochrome c oxidase subunit II [Verrucomicrobiota bacterium]MEC8691863.1 cbb3-type cytochrome c oxidase subunit II [Verrucomicrobiota bacterium]
MTSFRKFILGIGACFFFPWLCLVILPSAKMNADVKTWADPDTGQVNAFPSGKPNIFRQGQIIYAQEGCASCHTQMIRPTYMGFESWRPDFGKEGTIEEPVRTRETRIGDYDGERFAYLGNQRIGPDLSNAGYRHDESWHHEHLYSPRSKRDFSMMPSFRHLYIKRKIRGQKSESALKDVNWEDENDAQNYEIVPTERAKALVGYIMTLKKDDPFGPVNATEEQETDVK